MNRVFTISNQSTPSCFAAVLIGQTGPDQRHVGILHRKQGSPPELLHLAWHCRLQNDANIPGYMSLWVLPNAKPRRLRQLAAYCRRVWNTNRQGGVPYAFSRPDGALDVTTGRFLIGPSQFGLTCATFVLAVFHATGLQLVNYAEWPVDRLGDKEWQLAILEKLEGHSDNSHLEHVRSEIGSVRYRPEEVAAAATVAPPAATFQVVADLANSILGQITQSAG